MTDKNSSESPPATLFLQSPLLAAAGFAHGFFLRGGGVSGGVFSSLNFTTATGDSPEHVHENLKRAGTALGVDPEKIYFLSQVHGADSTVVTGAEDRAEVENREGDIVLTKDRGVAAAIRTADCVSVLVACKRTGWVAACHAGWQGCVRNVVPATLEALRRHLGTENSGDEQFLAAIGPHISLASFEVSDDVAQQLLAASPDKGIIDSSYEKPHVDLRRMVRAQLRECGLQDENIDDVQGCTVLDEANFFSFRRDGNPSGRMLSAIVGLERD